MNETNKTNETNVLNATNAAPISNALDATNAAAVSNVSNVIHAGRETSVQNNYKDTIFRMLFKEKENLLSLYNALNQTAYTDADSLEITTLENAVYMNYKNDVSFVFDLGLMLYEHQSTVNPNMPLRDLIYVTKVLQGIVRDEDLYGSALIKIPAPRFVVFYNGTAKQPEQQTLKLSDAYEKEEGQPELELTVTVYNINWGHNPKLLNACRLLKEYAQYVDLVRTYAKKMDFPEAVESAVDYCIGNGILADFLAKNRSEAIAVCIFEYDEEKHMRHEREVWKSKGREEGRKEGHEEGREETLVRNVEFVMENFKVDLQSACKSLKITVSEYERYKENMTGKAEHNRGDRL